MVKWRLGWVWLTVLVGGSAWGQPAGKAELLEARKIWDAAPHNAFTDLTRFGGKWFCAFREAQTHLSADGAVRVIQSPDGDKWESAARITMAGADLRDPKICPTPDGRLMVTAAAVTSAAGGGKVYQSMVWSSADGQQWGAPTEVGKKNVWLWRVVWHAGKAYGVGYSTNKESLTRFYVSDSGAQFARVCDLFDKGQPNEAGLVFQQDGTAYCLLRRDAGTGQLGVASPPYTQWTWHDLGRKIGGPALLGLPDGRLVAAVRVYEGGARTVLCWVEPDGKFTEFLKLPSGGDTSYPGMVFYQGVLWVSYYSSHEGKTAIYLAKVKLP